jgi:ribonuclease P protein component
LTSGAEFQALFKQGRRIDRPSLVVLWGGGRGRRAGFAVSRQIRGAVNRNRARRRLREAYRAAREAAPDRAEVIVIARPGALTGPFLTLVAELRTALAAIPRVRS